MNSQFQSSYARVESSLQKLTDSIAAYNPSIRHAQELLAADEAVNENIEQLIIHQQNHARLVSLRATADSLDETIKTTIRLLADTRKEIQSIPALDDEEDRKEVAVEDLLQYAKFIAPTTVPPTFRKPLVDDHMPTKKDVEVGANGIATPEGDAHQPEAAVPAPPPPVNNDFSPWPWPAQMNSGALGSIQRILENGQDPATVPSKEEQAEVDRKKKELEEEEKRKAEELERQQRDAFGYGGGRRGTAANVVFDPDDL